MLRLSRRYEQRDRKSAISLQRGQFDPKFQVQGVAPPIILARIVRPMNALQFCRWQFNCSRLSSSEVRFQTKIGRFAFLRPLLGDLGATYDDHLRLIGKRVVDFLLVLIELFFARCYGWGGTGEYRLKIDDFFHTGASWPKILRRRNRPHQPFFFSENQAKWFFVWYKNLDRSFFHYVTNHAFDIQTDRQFSSLDRVYIACSAVKLNTKSTSKRLEQ